MSTQNGYAAIGQEIGELVAGKQAAYGDSFGKSGAVMRILYPNGIPPEKLDDALTVVRVLDKLFRIATDRDALGESPWRDVAGYALLAVRRVAETPTKKREPKPYGCGHWTPWFVAAPAPEGDICTNCAKERGWHTGVTP